MVATTVWKAEKLPFKAKVNVVVTVQVGDGGVGVVEACVVVVAAAVEGGNVVVITTTVVLFCALLTRVVVGGGDVTTAGDADVDATGPSVD